MNISDIKSNIDKDRTKKTPTRIKFFDTTLRDGEQTPSVNLNLKEKLDIAYHLERLGIDYIEAGFAISSPGDFEAVKTVADHMKNSAVVSLARAVTKDIDAAWEALKNAAHPRIHTFIATSDIHMQYKLKMSPEQVLENAVAAVKYAKKYTNDVEFSAEDATRTRPEFLAQIMEAVIEAGATCINIPDTVGFSTPYLYDKLIRGLVENVPNIDKSDISVHCHNDLGLAVAESLAAIGAGATQIEGTINGLGERAGNAALEEVIMALKVRQDFFNCHMNIDTTQIMPTSRKISILTGISPAPNKAIVGKNVFLHESGIHQHGVLANPATYEIFTPKDIGMTENIGISLGKLSGKHAFEAYLKERAITLESEALNQAFNKFKQLADRKKEVNEEDILAIVEDKMNEIPHIYELVRFQINTGNNMISTATMEIRKENEVFIEAGTGDGPIDAAYNAISRLTGLNIELKDYSIRAVTGGQDALGSVNVRIVCEGTLCRGKGISTDILEASILAYINSINRYLFTVRS